MQQANSQQMAWDIGTAAASVGSTIISATAAGSVVPGVGNAVGFFIGAVSAIGSVVKGILQSKEQLREIKRAQFRYLITQYNNSVFSSAVSRLQPAMEHLVELGVKPGTDQFESLLEKQIADIGYRANCNIDVFAPDQQGTGRKILARIDQKGGIQLYDQFFDNAHGPEWAKICKDLHLAALQMWAAEQEDSIEFQRMLQQQQDQNKKVMITSIMVTAGLGLLLLGYNLRQKKKLRK